MKTTSRLLTVAVLLAGFTALAAADNEIPNPLIDYKTFLQDAAAVGELRSLRRLTEDDFIRMSKELGTIVLDARSTDKFKMLHISGASHLSLTDVTADALAKVIPDRNTRILIYCNNNFLNEPQVFASKSAPASLNIYTFNTLYSYGYRNVYELGPLLDIRKTKLKFEGSKVQEQPAH